MIDTTYSMYKFYIHYIWYIKTVGTTYSKLILNIFKKHLTGSKMYDKMVSANQEREFKK